MEIVKFAVGIAPGDNVKLNLKGSVEEVKMEGVVEPIILVMNFGVRMQNFASRFMWIQ